MSGKPFIAISNRFGWSIRKYRPAAHGSWDVWYWAGGWAWVDNVDNASALRAIEEADEVFFESNFTQANPWIVELERGCWLADTDGDPGRTLVEANAQKFASFDLALDALNQARIYRPFKYAIVKPASPPC